MILPNEPGKINFLIGVHASLDRILSGGTLAMHRLAWLIAMRGHNAFVFSKPAYEHPNLKEIKCEVISTDGFIESYAWEGFGFQLNNTVAVYPQVTGGNPFNTSHIARWIMYDTERLQEESYGSDEEFFNFGSFKVYKNVPTRKLTVFDYNLDKFYIANTKKRKGFCHINHKHTPPGGLRIMSEISSLNLSDWRERGGFDYLREQFNDYEYMLTYDQKSFYTVAAGLCGCKTIILNPGRSYEFAPNANSESEEYKEPLTPEMYRRRNPIAEYGVAYGWNDIHWANDTIHLVRDHVKILDALDNKTVDNFIDFWKNRLAI